MRRAVDILSMWHVHPEKVFFSGSTRSPGTEFIGTCESPDGAGFWEQNWDHLAEQQVLQHLSSLTNIYFPSFTVILKSNFFTSLWNKLVL